MKRGNRLGGGTAMLGLLMLVPVSWARLEAIPEIGKLVDSAPVIVIGEVVAVDDAGTGELDSGQLVWSDGKTYTVDKKIASVRVIEVLKGEVSASLIRIAFDENPNWESGPSIWNVPKGDRRVFFLRSAATGYAFSEAEQYSMPVSRDQAAVPQVAGEDLYAVVVRRMAAGLFSVKDAAEDRRAVVFRLSTESSPVVTELFRMALAGPAARADEELRFELLAALVRRGEEAELPALEAALFSTEDPRLDNARSNMVLALQQAEPARVGPVLIRALRDQEPSIRATAAVALQNRYDDDAVEALLRAVDDPDRNVQFQVMEALASILKEHRCVMTSPEEREAFAACVDIWRGVAARRGDGRSAAVH